MTRRIKRPGHLQGTADLRNTTDFSNLPAYSVTALPSAANAGAGRVIYVSDGTSNQRIAVSDGAAWRFPSGTVVS